MLYGLVAPGLSGLVGVLGLPGLGEADPLGVLPFENCLSSFESLLELIRIERPTISTFFVLLVCTIFGCLAS